LQELGIDIVGEDNKTSPTIKSQPASSASSQNRMRSSPLALGNINVISNNTSNNTPNVHTPNTAALVNQFPYLPHSHPVSRVVHANLTV
jgi:hypothetical protein